MLEELVDVDVIADLDLFLADVLPVAQQGEAPQFDTLVDGIVVLLHVVLVLLVFFVGGADAELLQGEAKGELVLDTPAE